MTETIRDGTAVPPEDARQSGIDGIAVDGALLERLQLGLDAALQRQRAHCAAIDFDVPLEAFRAVLLTETREHDDA